MFISPVKKIRTKLEQRGAGAIGDRTGVKGAEECADASLLLVARKASR
jgi:hypothetical protein